MKYRALLLTITLLAACILPVACVDTRNQDIPETDVERDTGEKDRRGFKIFSGGASAGAILQTGTRFVSRSDGQYEVYSEKGGMMGFIVGHSGEVYDFRGHNQTTRKVDTVDVTTLAGLARAAEEILQLPAGVRVMSASAAALQKSIKGTNKN